MSDISAEYEKLIESFLSGAMPVEELRDFFRAKFKHETRPLDEVLSLILDGFTSDLETYTADKELLGEKPKLFLNEKQIRERAKTTLLHLSALKKGRSRTERA
jgi:hypothetical protein